MEVGPWGMFSMANVPLASVVAHKSRFDTLTMAYGNGCKVLSSITRPDTLKRPSMAIAVDDVLAVATADIIKNSINAIAFLIP